MSQLDGLDPLTGHSHSLSGFPMRPKKPKAEPSAAELVAIVTEQLANKLAESQGQLTKAVANALTSRPAVEPARVAPTHVSMRFTKNAAGLIDTGTVTNGDSTWGLVFNRSNDGVTVEMTPI